jgi:exportin-T
MDAVLVIDQDLVTDTVRTRSLNTMTAYRNGHSLEWNDAELAIYLVYIFGEINKCKISLYASHSRSNAFFTAGGKGRAAFCLSPAPAPDREKRKTTDYSNYPLTIHGEMLLALVQSGISAYPHRTVVMQFFETVARYGDFFKVRKECIMPTLDRMVGVWCVLGFYPFSSSDSSPVDCTIKTLPSAQECSTCFIDSLKKSKPKSFLILR